MWLPVLFGVGTGLFSALYNTALLRVTEFHDHQKLVPAPLKPLLPFLLSGVLLYVYPQVLVGLGYSTADLGGLTPNGPLLLGPVALLLCVKIIFSILSFASGVPGGLLMPMLAIGSMVGAVGGTLLIGNGFSAEPQLPAYLVLGMAGLFDPASSMELKKSDEDFGQALGYWGLGSGPYLMLPLLGPTTGRDIVDPAVRIVAGPTAVMKSDTGKIAYTAVNAVDVRDQLLPLDKTLDEQYDEYSFVRDSYLQRRWFKLHDGNPPHKLKFTSDGDDEDGPSAVDSSAPVGAEKP